MNTQSATLNNQSLKRERIEFRVTQKLKALLQRAADIQGRPLSDFLSSTAEKVASEVIQENQIIQFSVEDSLAFTNALFNSPKPNTKLQNAYKKYKKSVASR